MACIRCEEVQARRAATPFASGAAYSAEQAAIQEAFQTQQEELRRKLAEEKNRHWTGQEPLKNQQTTLQARAASVADRGRQAEVISQGAQVDIAKHLALGNVYNRGGRLIGPVVGADVEKVMRYVVQGKTGG